VHDEGVVTVDDDGVVGGAGDEELGLDADAERCRVGARGRIVVGQALLGAGRRRAVSAAEREARQQRDRPPR